MHTGMRASEAAGLRRQDVDLDRQTITIKKTKSKTPRTVPLTEAVALALSGLKAKDYFFLTESELTKPHLQKRPAQKFRESWEATKGRAILSDPSIPKEITLHDIRHSAATHLIESEVPLRTVADILGHKTIQMTMRYTHPSMKHKAEMMQRIEGFGVDPQIEISEERMLLIHQLTEALLLAKSQCADEDLVKALEGIAAYSQRVSLS
jgi:integrase